MVFTTEMGRVLECQPQPCLKNFPGVAEAGLTTLCIALESNLKESVPATMLNYHLEEGEKLPFLNIPIPQDQPGVETEASMFNLWCPLVVRLNCKD